MSLYDQVLDDEAPEPDAPAPSLYDQVLDEEQKAQQTAARAAIERALKDKPDVAAERVRLQQTSGLPLRVIERNLDEVRVREQARAIDLARMAQESPVLARQLADPTFTSVAVDDIPTLKKVETEIGRAVRYVMGADGKGGLPRDLRIGLINRGIEGLAGAGRAAAETAAVPFDFLEQAESIGGNPLRRLAEGFSMIAAEQSAIIKRDAPTSQGNIGAGVSSGVQSIGQFGKYAPLLAFGPAGGAAALLGMAIEAGGASYQKAREKNLPQGSALVYAAADGLVEYATEKLPLDTLIRGVVANDALVKVFAKTVAKEIPGEQVATLLQDMNEWAALNPEKPFAEYLRERPDAAAQTLVATIVGTGGNVVLVDAAARTMDALTGTQWRTDQAQEFQKHLDAMLKASEASALRQRTPEQFRAVVQKMVDAADGAPKSVHVDAEVLNQLPAEVLNQLPASVRDQLADAAVSRSTVEIPMVDVLAVAPGTPLADVLNQYGRVTPDAMTPAEADQVLKQTERWSAEAQKTIQQAQDQAAAQAEFESIRAAYAEQIKATNRYRPAVAGVMPVFLAAFYTTMASRAGTTASEFQARYPLRVVDKPTVAGQPVMDQGRRLQPSPVLNTPRTPTAGELRTNGRVESVPLSAAFSTQGQRQWDRFNAGQYPPPLVEGFNDKPVAVKLRSGEYLVLDGHHRTEKALQEGRTDVEMHVIDAEVYDPENAGRQRANTDAIYDDALLAELANELAPAKTPNGEPRRAGELEQSSGFDRFVGGATVVGMDDSHEFVAGEPVVVAAVHGTTGDFTAFDPSAANIESDLGGGFYFTNNTDEVSANYAGLGPDLTQKIELEAERLESNDDLDPDEARRIAREKWMANEGLAMPVWVKFNNPVVLGGQRETFLLYEESYDEETDEYGEPTGDLVKVIEALREVAGDERYGDFDAEQVITDVMERAAENGGISAREFWTLAKGSEGLTYASDYEAEGKLASTEILRRVFEAAGFDGFIDTTVDEKFGSASEAQRKYGKGMKGMHADTVHFIAFKPTQIKSRIGNDGTFDADDPSILSQQDDQPRGTFNPRTLELVLNPNANLSTWFHETGHFFLEVLADVASQPNAPAQIAQIAQDWAKVLEWFGIKGDEDVGGADSGVPLAQSAEDVDAVYREMAADQELLDALDVYRVTGDAPEGALNDRLVAYMRRLPPVSRDFYRNQPAGARPWTRGWASWTINEDQTRFFGGGGFEVVKRSSGQGLDLGKLGDALSELTGDYYQWALQGEWLLLNESVGFNQDGPTPTAQPLPKRRTPQEVWAAMTLDQKRPYHERWAESVEQYVMEGKAPSVELQPVMRRFAAWLKSVYGSIKAFLASRGVPVAGGDALNQPAYHGTPHRGIDKFSTEFIGTGEGNQAYGWGLYFASKKEIAERYRMVLSSGYAPTLVKDGVELSSAAGIAEAYYKIGRKFRGYGGDDVVLDFDRQDAYRWAVKVQEVDAEGKPKYGTRPRWHSTMPDFKDLERVLKAEGYDVRRGQLYEVEIPEDSEMLLWDKPLSEQPERVQQAVYATGYTRDADGMTGKELYEDTVDSLAGGPEGEDAQELASKLFMSKGIKGIKYLDGTSRAAGDGSYNYVIFSGDDVQIRNQFYQDPTAQPGPNLQLNDDIRRVMDRMLATDEQIAQAEEVAGMMPSEEATDAAAARLRKRSMRDLALSVKARDKAITSLRKEAKAFEKAIRAEVVAEVDQMPVYLAKDAVERAVKETDTDPVAADAKLDSIATQYGYTSIDHMMREIENAAPKAEVIDGRVDQRMLEEHGELIDERAIQNAANEAVHNEARARALATEFKAQQEMLGKREDTGEVDAAGRKVTVNVLMAAAKQFAANVVARTTILDLRSKAWQHTAAERRASKRWQEATAGGKTQEAVQAKQDQVLNNAATKATLEADAEARKLLDYLKKFDKAGVREKLPPEYLDQIDKLLERIDLRVSTTGRDIDRRASLSAWIASQHALGLDPVLPDNLLENVKLKSYKEMAFDEFVGLTESIKNIEHLGRLKSKLLAAKDKREFDAIATEWADSIRANGGKPRPVNLEGDGPVAKFFKGAWAEHRKLNSLVRQMDGGEAAGPGFRFLIQSMNERGTQEDVALEKATMALADIFAPVEKLPGGLSGDKRFIPEINNSLSRAGRLAIALNWGNAQNRQRVMDGDGWTEAQVNAILATLTETELQFVNKVWEHIDSYWPEVKAKQLRVSGVVEDKVEAEPFTLTGADGATVQMRGGYYPIKYDPDRSMRAQINEAKEIAAEMLRGAMLRPTTRRGHTKARVDEVKNRPIRKDLAPITQHVQQVVHDLAWHEWAVDANRLLADPRISAAIREHHGAETHRAMTEAVEAIVVGDLAKQTQIDKLLLLMRANVTRSIMGVSATTALLQPFGLTQSMARIGVVPVLKGAARWAGDAARMESTLQWVHGKSDFMRLRAKTFNRDLREINATMRGKWKATKVMDAVLFFPMQKMQMIADVPTWIGMYEKALAEGRDEATAVALADEAVLSSQGGGSTKDLAGVQRNLPFLTQFYSYFSTTLNLVAEKTALTNWKNPRAVAGWVGDMALLAMIPAILPALITYALKGGGEDDEPEDWAKRLLEWQAAYMLGLFVGLRELPALWSPFDYQGPPVGKLVNDGKRLVQQAGQGEIDDPAVLATIGFLGTALGIPTTQIIRSYKGWKAWDEGDAPVTSILFGPPPKD